MSLLREEQIKEILDADNFFKRIVNSRIRQSVRGYDNNIVNPQILDVDISATGNTDVEELFKNISNLRLGLKVKTDNLEDYEGQIAEFKTLKALDISKNFRVWEKLMTEFGKPNINQITKESLIKKLQKLTPYIQNINDMLTKTIEDMAYILASKTDLDDGEPIIGGEELFEQIYKISYQDAEGDPDVKINQLRRIDVNKTLPIMIENLAFYKAMNNIIDTTLLKPITQQDITDYIVKILNELTPKLNFANKNIVVMKISTMFNNNDIPNLLPYLKSGLRDFDEYYNELQAMDGNAIQPQLEPPPEGVNLYGQPEGEEKEDEPEALPFWQLMQGQGKPKRKDKTYYKNNNKTCDYNDMDNDIYYNSSDDEN